MLEKGLSRRVGDGNNIKVWCDPWIQDEVMKISLMKNILINIDMLVCEVIDHKNRSWKRDSLEDQFFAREVEIILAKKLIVDVEDFWVWDHEKNGSYSVKSGYWLANSQKNDTLIHEAEALPSINGIRELIWKLQGPLKLKNFLWRALSGAIPVVNRLLSRRVKVDTRCHICGLEGESINHVLFKCTATRQIWAMADVPSPQEGFKIGSIFSNIYFILELTKNILIPLDIRRSIPWIWWRIWKNKNLLVFEERRFSASYTILKIRDESAGWFMAQIVEQESQINQCSVEEKKLSKWKPPHHLWFKCNIGRAWYKDKRLRGGGWVVRDSQGIVLYHSRKSFHNLNSLEDTSLRLYLGH